MKSHFILLFCLIWSSGLFAQVPESFEKMSDPSAFRKAAKEKADKVRTIKSEFTQVKEMDFMEEAVESKGRFAFKEPNYVAWEYTEPFQHKILIRDDKLSIKGEKKKDEYEIGSNEMFQKMNEMIVSSVRGQVFDNEDFQLAYYENESAYLVAMKPRDKGMKEFFEQMQLYFSKGEYEVKKVVMLGSSDDSTTITFQNKEVNVPIPKERFE